MSLSQLFATSLFSLKLNELTPPPRWSNPTNGGLRASGAQAAGCRDGDV